MVNSLNVISTGIINTPLIMGRAKIRGAIDIDGFIRRLYIRDFNSWVVRGKAKSGVELVDATFAIGLCLHFSFRGVKPFSLYVF